MEFKDRIKKFDQESCVPVKEISQWIKNMYVRRSHVTRRWEGWLFVNILINQINLSFAKVPICLLLCGNALAESPFCDSGFYKSFLVQLFQRQKDLLDTKWLQQKVYNIPPPSMVNIILLLDNLARPRLCWEQYKD